MSDQKEWAEIPQKADETVEKHRKGDARLRFLSAEGKTEA